MRVASGVLVVLVVVGCASGLARADEQGLGAAASATWKIAALDAAHRGRAALPELEAAAERHPERARLALSVLLLEHAGAWAAVEADHPKLAALARPEVEAAREDAQPFLALDDFDLYEPGLRAAPDRGPRPPRPDALLQARQGFAVPALLELAASPRPGARLTAARALCELQAVAATDALRALARDAQRVHVRGADWTSNGTVGEMVTSWLGSHHPWAEAEPRPSDEAERYLERTTWGPAGGDLINDLRQKAGAYEATSWADYWRRVRSHLESLPER